MARWQAQPGGGEGPGRLAGTIPAAARSPAAAPHQRGLVVPAGSPAAEQVSGAGRTLGREQGQAGHCSLPGVHQETQVLALLQAGRGRRCGAGGGRQSAGGQGAAEATATSRASKRRAPWWRTPQGGACREPACCGCAPGRHRCGSGHRIRRKPARGRRQPRSARDPAGRGRGAELAARSEERGAAGCLSRSTITWRPQGSVT
jgi:hypothetical protein